ncbi:hypothetical protein [Embleya sp. NBC_00896]|uniref:hypothetical protein n=1 Tax=Embleya sp. NBC_00896 TaxID=2975961 RepID=UPI00386C63C8|nr:hypothetical protein OG928_08000 [Embleya sp. NBC_00896]
MRPGPPLLVAATLLLAGCAAAESHSDVQSAGAANSGLDTEQLLERAGRATADLRTVHMVAALKDNGTPVTVDVRVRLDSRDFAGRLDYRGNVLTLTRVGKDLYVKADPAYLAKSTGITDQRLTRALAGKYLKAPAGDPRFAGIEGFLRLADPGPALLDAKGRVSKRPVELRDGVALVPLSGPSEDQVSTSTMYIAEHGAPRVARIVNDDVNDGATISYDRFDEPLDLPPPPPNDVVELPR